MFIQEIDLFKEIPQEVMNEIADIAADESCEKDTYVFNKGDQANYFYILEEGRVKLIIEAKGNITTILSNTGDAFGWSSLVDHHVYTASALCATPSTLVKIESRKLAKVFKKYPDSSALFYKRLAGIVGRRLITAYALLTGYRGEGQSLLSF